MTNSIRPMCQRRASTATAKPKENPSGKKAAAPHGTCEGGRRAAWVVGDGMAVKALHLTMETWAVCPGGVHVRMDRRTAPLRSQSAHISYEPGNDGGAKVRRKVDC